MDNEVRYERNPAFIFRKVVDEAVLVPIHQDVANMDCIYTLNDLGALIWGMLEKTQTLDSLKSRLLDEYDVEPEILTADLNNFLDEMASINAIKVV